jgi:ketosteroid isomerase-like protein
LVRAAYAAFGRGDIPAVLELVHDNVDWVFHGAKGLPYTRSCRTKSEVAEWFASIPKADDIQGFEPREFFAAGDTVTVLGRERVRPVPAGKTYETEWVHILTVRDGRLVRFWGMYGTQVAAEARA